MNKEIKYLTFDQIEGTHCTTDEVKEISIVKTAMDNVWSVYVSDNKMLTKLKRVMKQPGGERIKCWEAGRCDGYPTGYFFELPVECLAFKARKKTRKRELTEEQRKAIGQRFKEGRAQKLTKNEN